MIDSTHSKMRVRDALRSRDASLHRRAEHLIAEAVQLLPHTLSTFPSGTNHGPEHAAAVECIGGLLLPSELLAELSNDELFFLTLVFHYHDLGMVGTEEQNATAAGRDRVRREHAISITQKLADKWQVLGFENENESRILGEICRGHRPIRNAEGRASWDDLDNVAIVGIDRQVRLRLMAAMIYAIDELHLGEDRAPERVSSWKAIRDDEAQRHWRRHESISGPTVLDEKLTFQVLVRTIATENDLRRNVLRKALLAVDDLRHQLAQEGIEPSPRSVAVRWDRRYLWKLLVVKCLANCDGLVEAQLVEQVIKRHHEDVQRRIELGGLCDEDNDSEEELRAAVLREIRDMVQQDWLQKDDSSPSQFILSSDQHAATSILGLLRSADDLDRLFVGPYAADNELSVFGASYGKRFVEDVVFRIVEDTYSVERNHHPAGRTDEAWKAE